ncbi:MAG: hypothetical protein ACRCV6_08310 [Formosimonas sp.]
MSPFNTHCPDLARLLPAIIQNDALHARWLNSLSMMESVGARKIAAYVHPIEVDLITLQHAFEEARHAYFLKKQISKLKQDSPSYAAEHTLAPRASYRYLHKLDMRCARYLADLGHTERELKHGCYLLVTYLIEVRAMLLYHTYQAALDAANSRVHVKSIISEEAGHLENMMTQLDEFNPRWRNMSTDLHTIEHDLYHNWLRQIQISLKSTSHPRLPEPRH